MKIHKKEKGVNITRCSRNISPVMVVSETWDDVDCERCLRSGGKWVERAQPQNTEQLQLF